MLAVLHFRRAYDHRLRDAITRSRNPQLFPALCIPGSTSRSWIARGSRPVVSADLFGSTEHDLLIRVARLQHRVAVLTAVVVLLVALVRALGLRLQHRRMPPARTKRVLLAAISRSRNALPLSAALRVLGLSASRYHAWHRAELRCTLSDHSSCPRSSPTQATPAEHTAVKDMVTAGVYRHMPVSTLARLAQRTGRVFVSASTWHRLVRTRGWRRPCARVYPPKPKLGIRASGPNELWHVDTTMIRLLDGTRAFICAVIDNFSRLILAWEVAPRLSPLLACKVLARAAQTLPACRDVTVYSDAGSENVNADVRSLLIQHGLRHVLAQVEIAYSNSMIEAFWRSLKHNWLYLNSLDSIGAVTKLVAFFVDQHNTAMPHSAFAGQTPAEMHFGTGDHISAELANQKALARQQRLAINRAIACETCPHPSAIAPPASARRKPR